MADEEEWEGVWVAEPPERNDNPRTRWVKRLEPLTENPGRWARFGPFAGSGIRQLAGRVRAGKYGEGFDAYTHREDGSHWLYACFEDQS